MELAISSTERSPSTESLRDYQKRVARYVYRTGLEFHSFKIHSYEEILGITPRHEGYKLPSSVDLNGWLLQEIQDEIKVYVEDVKESWKSTGCSILLDGWKDGNRNLISILVGCPKGAIYLKSADISESDALKILLDKVLVDVGVENVVQIISHSTSPMIQEIGKNLADEYPSFFWTVSGPCCIKLMLKKLSSMDLVRNVMKEAKTITRFIHDHLSVLKLLRNRTSICGLVKRSTIRSAVPFLTLQNMVIESAALKKFFRSSAWKSSRWASTEEGKMTAQLVANHDFWEGANLVVKAIMPLVNVLEWMNGDNDHLGNIYETIDQAKETIREEMKDEDLGHTPFWEAIDDIWNEYLHSPLHAMGYFLNPYLFYAGDFSSHAMCFTSLHSLAKAHYQENMAA